MTKNWASKVVSSLGSMLIICKMGILEQLGIKKLCMKSCYDPKNLCEYSRFLVCEFLSQTVSIPPTQYYLGL